MHKTSIPWVAGDDGSQGYAWNPMLGCMKLSAGCEHCYACRLAATRLVHSRRYVGLADMTPGGPMWTGKINFDIPELLSPMRVKKPSRVFVCDMGDLFYAGVSNEQIAAVFGVMAACPQHEFFVLTKRARRMSEWFSKQDEHANQTRDFYEKNGLPQRPRTHWYATQTIGRAEDMAGVQIVEQEKEETIPLKWPLPNVRIGVTAENQEQADERIPWLLDVPAAVRFVSIEPQLGPVDLQNVFPYYLKRDPHPHDPIIRFDVLRGHVKGPDEMIDERVGWVICGGESGPKARPFDLDWMRTIVRQCRETGVPVFCKQMGTNPVQYDWRADFKDRAGADPSEWPGGPGAWPREFPEAKR